MRIHTLAPSPGSRKTTKRIGRGQGSGKGGTSTKGHKGDQSRAGHHDKRGFEGGQTPLARRLPKFGFTNHNRVSYEPINLERLVQLLEQSPNQSVIDHDFLFANGAIRKPNSKVKILGRGELSSRITVKANKFSASAQEAITAAGGAAITV
jgi:large subunit ribosomal protein L15